MRIACSSASQLRLEQGAYEERVLRYFDASQLSRRSDRINAQTGSSKPRHELGVDLVIAKEAFLVLAGSDETSEAGTRENADSVLTYEFRISVAAVRYSAQYRCYYVS